MAREQRQPLIPKKMRQRSPLEPPKNAIEPQPPRKPLGQGIDWSDEDLDAMADISTADMKAAAALWYAEAPAPLRGLLDAKVEETK